VGELLYLEQMRVGQRFTSASATVSEAEIKAFARQFDPQVFHLDNEGAKDSLFGGLAASGWHTAAITMRLQVEGGMPFVKGVIGASGELAWPKPTRPGDTLHVENEILAITPSKSRRDRGMAKVKSETKNQNGDVVQTFTVNVVVWREPSSASPLVGEGREGG
jgi:acyl dehydratase